MKERNVHDKQALKAIENYYRKITLDIALFKYIGKNGIEVVTCEHGTVKKIITVSGAGSCTERYYKEQKIKKYKKKMRRARKRRLGMQT